MDLELKFRGFSKSRNQGKFDWQFLGTRILMKLGQQLPVYTLLQEKIKFPAKADQKFEFLLKVEFELTSR
jgi:hypothetical protein